MIRKPDYTPASRAMSSQSAIQTQDGKIQGEVDFLQLVLRYKWILLIAAIGGMVLGELGYRKLGPRYEAKSKILVSHKVSVPLRDDDQARRFGDRGEHIALIMSPMIVSQAIETYKLDELQSLSTGPGLTDDILDNLMVKRTAGLDTSFHNVFELTFQCVNRADAVKVMQAIVDTYGEYLKKDQMSNTEEVMKMVTDANTQLNTQLKEKQEKYLNFRNNAPLHWKSAPGAKGGQGEVTNIHLQRLKAIATDRQTNLLKKAQIEARLNALKDAMAKNVPREEIEKMVKISLTLESVGITSSTGPSPEAAALDAQLLPLLVKEKNLERDLGDDNYELISVRKSIETVLAFYRQKGIRLPDEVIDEKTNQVDFVELYIRSLNQILVELEHRDQRLTVAFNEESKEAKKLTAFLLEDQSLNEEIERVKATWKIVVDKAKSLPLNNKSDGYNMKQIAPSRAELVVKRHIKFIAAGCFACLLGVLGLAYLWTVQDTTVRTLNDVRDSLNLPLLGAIPEFTPVSDSELANTELSPYSTSLHYLHRPDSATAEAFRSVRTALLVYAESQEARVIQVTSPLPGDGKTTFASNLALAIAQSGKEVLLIDADMRRPQVHRMFGMANETGTSDVLAGQADVFDVVRATQFEGLSLITSGSTPANPAELLTTQRLSYLVHSVQQKFDVVLIDTPPLLAVSDPCVVASQADGLLLVLRMEKSEQASAQRAAELLDTHGVTVLGAVANGLTDGLDDKDYSKRSNKEMEAYLNSGGVSVRNRSDAEDVSGHQLPI